jgi:DNA-binding SARP family transcriptional activator
MRNKSTARNAEYLDKKMTAAGKHLNRLHRSRLTLLGEFSLRIDDDSVSVAPHLQRLLALLSLCDTWLSRRHVSGVLWGDSTEEHARGSLRSTLWKLRGIGLKLVENSGENLRLLPAVDVDVRHAKRLARDVMHGRLEEEALELLEPSLLNELLPGWYDGWVLAEREMHRQLSLHALECLCEHLTSQSRFGPAVVAGLATVSRDPLRESGYRALMKAYLAEGNAREAMRTYDEYVSIAARELGVGPSPQMRSLFEELPQLRQPVITPTQPALTPS